MNKNSSWVTVNKKTKTWALAAFLAIFSLYIILETLVTAELWVVKALESASLIAVSVLGTTLLTQLLIDIKRENDLISDVGIHGLLNSEEFMSKLPDEEKRKISLLLGGDDALYGNSVKREMCESMQHQIKSIKEEYYYGSLSYAVDCTLFDDRVQQVINKMIVLIPYGEEYSLKNYRFIGSMNRIFTGGDRTKNIIVEHIKIYHRKSYNDMPPRNSPEQWVALKEHEDYEVYIDEVKEARNTKNGYNVNYKVTCINENLVAGHCGIYIDVRYRLLMSPSDLQFTCSAKVPSKEFAVRFNLDTKTSDHVERVLLSRYFCPFDILDNTAQSDSQRAVDFKFDGWTFPGDGVAISITPASEGVEHTEGAESHQREERLIAK